MMRFYLFISAILLTLVSCQESFTREKWDLKVDGTYPKRILIVNDLLENNEFKGKSIADVHNSIGIHDDWCDLNPTEMRYFVEEDYGMNIDPVKVTMLVFKLEIDSPYQIDTNTIVKDVFIDVYESQ